MPGSLILRKYKSSEKVEVTFESLECLKVETLREYASTKLDIPLSDLSKLTILLKPGFFEGRPLCTIGLVFGGRVLKPGKTAVEYKVVPGCTVHAMDVKPKKQREHPSPSHFQHLYSSIPSFSLPRCPRTKAAPER